jgi:hypothetical protein
MSCILIRYRYDNNLEMIQRLVQVWVLATWWPGQESDWTEIGMWVTLTYSGTYVQSFRPIALAVTKHALLTNDNDGCRELRAFVSHLLVHPILCTQIKKVKVLCTSKKVQKNLLYCVKSFFKASWRRENTDIKLCQIEYQNEVIRKQQSWTTHMAN